MWRVDIMRGSRLATSLFAKTLLKVRGVCMWGTFRLRMDIMPGEAGCF